jgi:hypothetical protein
MKKYYTRGLIGIMIGLGLFSVNLAQQRLRIGLADGLNINSEVSQSGQMDLADAESFNAKKFGAKGNGKTDDTEAIRAAVRAIATAGGGKLVFPNGVYPISSPIDLPTGITIEGTNGNYNGNCQLRLVVPNQKLLTIGENRRRITIRDIELKAAPASVTPYVVMKGTIAIDARGSAPNSSFEMEFRNLTITGFDRGINVEDTKQEGAWQFDNVSVDHVTFAENNYGIYMDSQNADYWKISNCWFGVPPRSYGIYLRRSGFITIDTSTGGGPPTAIRRGVALASTFIYVTGGHGTLTIINSEAEEIDNFLEVVGPGNYANPITIINSIIGPNVMLRANCILVSIGNSYQANTVQTVDKGTDVLIHSFGDVAELPLNSGQTPKGASPFKLQVNSRVVVGSSTYRVDFGNPATFSRGVGIGTDPSPESLLNIASPTDNAVQLRLGSTQGYYYDVFRDTSGYLNFRGNQKGYTGFRFNGDIVPTASGTGNLGAEGNRWNSVRAVKVVSGDAVLADKKTGEELYRIREDTDNIYFDDIRTNKQLMRLDRDGNLYVTGKVVQNSQ